MVASYVYFGGEKRVRLGPRIDFLMDIFFLIWPRWAIPELSELPL